VNAAFLPAALAALVLAAGAAADVVVVPLTVRPGSLTMAPVKAVSRSSRISVTVVDARGRGAGWELLARSAGRVGRTVVVTGVELRCGHDSTCTLPGNTMHYPIMLSSYRSVPLLRAQRGTGMGTIGLTVRLAAPSQLGAALSFSVHPA
jgi:hypothetical protein